VSDTWPMLIAAGYLRRGLAVDQVAARTGLTITWVMAIALRLVRAPTRMRC